MTGGFLAQIEEAVDAVNVLSPTQHAWLGERSEPLPPHVERSLDAGDARGYLLHNIAHALYGNFYCQGAPTPAPRRPGGEPGGDGAFVRRLSAVNEGSGCWEPGWSVAGVANGSVSVVRGQLTLLAGRDECRPDDGGDLDPPAPVHVLMPKELLRLSPGFYMALCDAGLTFDDDVVRVYWNLAPAGAAAFISTATRALNERAVPARVKVVNDPRQYARCDAGVIYLRRDQFDGTRAVLLEVLDATAPWLRAPTPALTKRLTPGVGLAEDPGRGESFGLTRCEQIAEGVVRAYENGATSRHDRVDIVVKTLAERAIDIATPYLNEGSVDAYEPL